MVYDLTTVAQLLDMEPGPRLVKVCWYLNSTPRDQVAPFLVATDVCAHPAWTAAQVDQIIGDTPRQVTTVIHTGVFQ